MSELTKEHFEKSLKDLVTNETLDKKLNALTTKTDLEGQTNQLGVMINNAFQEQKDYMEENFKKIEEELDLRSAVLNLEKRIEKLEQQRR